MLNLKCQFWYLPQRASLARVGSHIIELSSFMIQFFWDGYLFVCFKWSSKRNSLTTHLGMVICTHYLARVYSNLTQGHFLQLFMSFRKCYFKDLLYVCLDKSFLDCTVFALAFFELWERTNWHPVSNTQRLVVNHGIDDQTTFFWNWTSYWYWTYY